jgi:NADPH-dependent glutamate synthase beta subunit-like oxidoreductase
MKKFEHINAATLAEAASALTGGKARIIAGGTDLLGVLKDEILPDYPETLVNIKTIPGMDYIKEEEGMLKIGALTLLDEIALNATVKEKYTALSEAAGRIAHPHIREMATIGGNICQLPMCWYFRLPNNRFFCFRKGGRECFAITGEGRYLSIFGGTRTNGTPCSTDCPGGVDIPSYLNKFREGDLAGASEILLNFNPLPAVTGRVCSYYCESDCNRGHLDEPMSIRSVERFIGDYILEHSARMYQPPQHETKKRVAVLGSGPAGLSAAHYLRRLGHSVTVFEAMENPGGMLIYGIPPYRLPKDIVKKQIQAIEGMGIQLKLKMEVGRDVSLKELRSNFDAVFCATGAWDQSSLRIEHEELVLSGLEFLTRINLGSRKAPGRKILVIGGGNVAVDVAINALRLGAEKVTIACLEYREEMPAMQKEVAQAIEEGVQLMPSWGPSRILKTNGKVSGMELVQCTSVFGSDGHFSPAFNHQVKQTVGVDQIILAIGQKPALSYVDPLLKVERDLIKVDPVTQSTNIENIFAGGDVTSGPASVITAIAAGRRAAASINRYLMGKETKEEDEEKIKSLARFNSDYLKKISRVKVPELPISERGMDTEDILSLSRSAAEKEVNRCFNCGCLAVNTSDIAPALIALNAKIKTTKRVIEAENFFEVKGYRTTVLEADEIVTEVRIPAPASDTRSAFIKFALRKSIDFPIVNCAAMIDGKGARICLNGVFNKPYRARKAEEAIAGKPINDVNAEAAGEAAVLNAVVLESNRYKVQIAKVLVKRAILACQSFFPGMNELL